MTAQAERIRCDHCAGHYVVDASSDGSPRVHCNTCGHVREGVGEPEEVSKALKDPKSPSSPERKSASALLDITPAPKLALADMDSAIDLGEPMGAPRRSRPSLNTTLAAGSSGAPSAAGGSLEPLLVKSFSQPPTSERPSKVEWAPKIDRSVIPPRLDDPASKPNENGPVTTKAPDSAEALDSSSLLEDSEADDEEAAPLSLRDVIQDDDELGDADLQEDDPDPHEKLSLRDLVVVPNTTSEAQPTTPSQKPPKPPTPSQAPVKAATVSQAPPARPKVLSRPDVAEPKRSLPPPTIRPDIDTTEEAKPAISTRPPAAKAKAVAKEKEKEEEKPNRTWMWVAVAAVLFGGIYWRVSQKPETPKTPETPAATTAPPTPVTTPAMTNDEPPTTPSASASDTVAAAPVTSTTAPTTTVANVPAPFTNTNPSPTPNLLPTPSATPAPAETKPTVSNSESPGSMSELLDQAGSAKRKGDLATARDLYTKVLAMSPTNVEANGGLGDVAKAQGDLAGAKTSYERALAASPTYSPALLGLADVEWDSGNQTEAKRRYAQIVERMGDRAPARAKERSQ